MIWESPTKAQAMIAGMARAGDHWVRIDIPWKLVERSPGTFSWGPEDTAVGAARSAGLQVDAIIDYAPTWGMTAGQPSASLYASFATAAVRRYAPLGVHTYEIWNEENLGLYWGGRVDATSYGRLLKAGYQAVHNADPSSFVLLGGLGRAPQLDNGLSEDPYVFLTQLYDEGFGRYFDAVAVHPYSYPDPPNLPTPDNELEALPRFYSLMQAHGDGAKKIWITEYGYPTTGLLGPAMELEQAQFLSAAIGEVQKQPWAGPFFIYSWQDDATQSFGLLRADGSAKPALAVFENATH